MAKSQPKNKNQHGRSFSLRDLRAAMGSFQGHPEKVAAVVYAAAKEGKFIAVEVINWLKENANILLVKADGIMKEWLATFGIKPTTAKGVWNV
jgi:hypothetical protein